MHKLSLLIDDYTPESFVDRAQRMCKRELAMVVTPNVDHLIRLVEEQDFREIYNVATYVLLDSRFARNIFALLGKGKYTVCTGSDLTKVLLSSNRGASGKVLFLGGTDEQIHRVAQDFQITNLKHFQPAMGLATNSAEIERCVSFIESESPFDYCFLAVGSPQQERIAAEVMRRHKAKGLLLCIGASLNFLTGVERRAPLWMQRAGLEWLFRLSSDPRRLAARYLIRGPRFFRYAFYTQVTVRAQNRD